MTLDEYKSFIARTKTKRSYRAIEDTIILNDITPHLRLWQNMGRLKGYWTKIANEALDKSILVGVKQKRMGKKAGVGDFYFHYKGKVVWLEVKQPGGEQSDAQKDFEKSCIEDGIGYSVVHSAKEAEDALIKWEIMKG